ncbi:MAG: phage capsid protein [Phycisphaerales bacterium]
MAITNFQREVWAAELLQSFLKQNKFSSTSVCNRNYEGDVAGAKSVKITSISRPTIAQYVEGTTSITFESLTDAQRTLYIDQDYYFAFQVGDIAKAQSANGGALMTEAAREAGAGLAENADTYVQGIMESDVAAANKIGATSITTSALAWARLVAHAQILNENNVPQEGRYTICPSWFNSLLMLDTNYMAYDAVTSGNRLENGVMGRVLGFDIIVANYALSTGDDWYVYSGVPQAVTFANQIDKVEALSPESAFSEALKGLHVYGAKVIRPASICMTLCSKT